jgi:hypothetical protein
MIAKQVFESIILPSNDITDLIEEIKSANVNNLEELNQIADKYGVIFSEYDEFYNTLTEEEKKAAPDKKPKISPEILFALYNYHIGKKQVVIDPNRFFLGLKRFPPIFFILNDVLRHESIHNQQVNRQTTQTYNLNRSPEKDSQTYLGDKYEPMAFAQTTIDQLSGRHRKNEILLMLKSLSTYFLYDSKNL